MNKKITSSKKNIFAYFVMIVIWISLFTIIAVYNTNAVLTDKVLYYYNFDETSGTTAIDSTNKYNGTIIGATVNQAGILGKSYYFDGTNDLVNTSRVYPMGLSTFSFSIWVKQNTTTGRIVGTEASGGEFTLRTDAGRVYCDIDTGTVATVGDTGTAVMVNSNTWNHIVVTYNGSVISLYANGTLMDTQADTGSMDLGTRKLYIGARNGGSPSNFIQTKIDEVGLWNRSLSSTEVSQLYNAGIGITYPFSSIVTPNFTITAKDYFNSSNICNFSAVIGATTYNSNITGCNITTNILQNSTSLYNITILAPNYFNRTYLNTNVSSDLVAYPYQVIVTLNATEILTENALTGLFSDGTRTNATTLYFNAGTHNITFVKSGYWNKTKTFTFSALQNISRTIENVSNSRINITATDLTDGSAVVNFTITTTINNISYTFSEDSTTTTGEIFVYVLKNQNYTVSIDADGYELKETSFIANAYMYNYTFELYTTNSILFNFKDAVTKAVINNVSIELISDIFSGNYSTTNGTYYIDLLSPAQYTIRSTSTGYYVNFYEFNLQNRTFTNLTIYLTSNTTGTQVTATVIDQYSSYLEGAFIKVLKYDIATNSYLLQEIAETNFEGKTMLNIVLNSEYYKFIIEYPFGTVRETTNPTYIYASTINFQINTGDELLSDYWNTQDVYVDLGFNNATNNFRYTYSDANNIASQGCLYVYTYTVAGLQLYNSSCVSSASSTILVGVANTTGTTYIAKAYISFDSDTYFMGDYSYTFPDSQPLGRLGVFIILVLTFIVAMTSYYSKTVALILTPMPMVIGAIMGIGVSVVMAILIEIVCIIVAVIISRN